jgi:hypothetical protein
MAENPIKQFNDEVVDIKQQSLYARLKRLFSTDVIVRNVGGKELKIKDTDNIMMATDRNSLRDRFNRIRSTSYNSYSRDFSLSYQAARMDLFRDYDCVGADTIIPLPDGSRPTIKELAEKYKDNPQERFYVFSYDHETDSIKLGKAYHPRKKKGTRQGYKVTFDDGNHIIGSLKHPFLMRDGSKKRLFELRVGDSVMPFYQQEYGYNKHGFRRYRRIYNFSKGWQQEHKIVAEQFYRPLEKNEVVHHKNFNGSDNSPENLETMDWREHKKFHSEHNKNVLWGDKNYDIQFNKLKSHPNYINRKIHHWNGTRKGKNNPFYGKQHSMESNIIRSKSLKKSFENRDISGDKNSNYRKDITFDSVKEKAFEYYKEYSKINLWDFIKHIHCDHSTLQNRLQTEGHDWKSFKQEVETTLNHKIVSIEPVGEIEVYDVTVEKYENFATDSCIVGNTMDMDPILASALDIYADECLTLNELKQMLVIHSKNSNIKEILHNLFYDILNIEGNLWSWTRNMCKYGDFFLRLYITPEYGIYMVEPISAYNVERVENCDPYNKRYVKFQIRPTDTSQVETVENYEMAHFRLLSDSNFLPYGKAMIESARRVWKQLSLMEDAMLIHRIMRAPERRIFKVDVGAIPPNEIDAYMEKLISKVKKVPYMDERTGEYNLRFNLQSMVEDIFLPVRGGDSGTEIDTLSGMEWTGIEDLDYIKHKMMAALKIPKAFLGYEEGISGKATLASEDVRFARTIQRIQRIIISELSKIAIVHLYAQGYRDHDLVEFELELTNPSTIFEREKVEIWQEKVSLATDMMEIKLFSRDWIYKNVFNMSDEDKIVVEDQVVEDTKQKFRLISIEEEGNDPAKPAQKINPGDIDGGEGGSDGPDGGGGGPDIGDIEGGPDGGGGGPESSPAGAPSGGGGGGGGPLKEKVEQDQSDRDQTGRKDVRDYPFGEDPRGALEIKSKPGTAREIQHKSRGTSIGMRESAVSKHVDQGMIKSLMEFMKKPKGEEHKQLLAELKGASNIKSYLDETNINDEQ